MLSSYYINSDFFGKILGVSKILIFFVPIANQSHDALFLLY
jgi:hypothetical protein